MSATSSQSQQTPSPLRPIEELRAATKLLVGRVARAFASRSWPNLRQVLLTQASKMPHRAYLDTELLEAAAPEIARLTRQIDTDLLRYETTPDAGQLAKLEPPVARLVVYLVRVYRLGALLPIRAGRGGMPRGTGLPPEHWEANLRQTLAQQTALRSELNDLGLALLRAMAAQEGGGVAPAGTGLPGHTEASTAHKLKVKVPLIPLFLDYEAEFEVGAKFDLGRLWQRVLHWFQGEPD